MENSDDSATRRAIVGDLDSTLFVEAGAGSGKTSGLVNRFVALVESGISADALAAITFTEKAAAELTVQIRERLEGHARQGNATCAEALKVLDRAAISTVHAFAQRILTEHPIEAGLPPRVTVMEGIAADLAFNARWEDYLDELLEDPAMELPIRLLLTLGGQLDQLRGVAKFFDANWDLLEDRRDRQPPPIPPVDVLLIRAGLEEVIESSNNCTSDDDKLFGFITDYVTDLHSTLRDSTEDAIRFEIIAGAKLKTNLGQKGNWGNDAQSVKDRLAELQIECETLRADIQDTVLQVIASSLAQFTLRGATDRQAGGELTFQDLLVLSRAALRDPHHGPTVRSALAQRYQRLLLDEFQDTDRIQVELAVLIASDDPNAGQKDWRSVQIVPGRLFFVGDPKQSIYRFRRADIATFLDTRDNVVGEAASLTRNFRTVRPILEWVNATFEGLIVEAADSQPSYTPLAYVRGAPEIGPAVAFIGMEHDQDANTETLRLAEARDVAAVIQQAIREQWSVGERRPDDTEAWRAARFSDIAILVPGRTSLDELERALERVDVPYRVEASSLVYGTREVRDLMTVVRAVDDPTDSLSVVAALRTPGFCCGDDDLAAWRKGYGGQWDYLAHVPDDVQAGNPVAEGLARLRDLHHQRLWKAPSDVIDSIARELRFFELGISERRPRDLWRRLRFVIDQCRALEGTGPVTLRQYLSWVKSQSALGTRAKESVLPESDDDAVRILTIHGAKGLEFPIVVMSGLTSEMDWNPGGVEVRFPTADSWAIKLSKDLSTANFEETTQAEDQRNHAQQLRLLYVAATRARDHLVVSVHRETSDEAEKTRAEVLYKAGWNPETVEFIECADEQRLPRTSEPGGTGPGVGPLPILEDWRRAHEDALREAAKPVAVSATQLAAEGASPRNDDEDSRLVLLPSSGYGAAIGSAVHTVMQAIELGTGEGLAESCSAQATADGLSGQDAVIESLCRSALDSDVIRRAANRRHWREVYVGVPDGDRVLEGYIDLLFEYDAGLHIVDYKTDAWSTAADLDAKVDRYRTQLQAYARAIRDAAGREVTGASLLFLGRNGNPAVERAVEL